MRRGQRERAGRAEGSAHRCGYRSRLRSQSAALYGSCTVKDGRIEQTNFHTYPVLKMEDMPKVETVLVSSGGFWGGVGEPTIAVAAPAVLNAIFAATGRRIRDLPLKDQNLKRA